MSDIQFLAKETRRGDLAFFVGDTLAGPGRSSWTGELVNESRAFALCQLPLCQRNQNCCNIQDCILSFADVAQYFEVDQHTRQPLVNFIKSHLEMCNPSEEIYNLLASLPLSVVLTTTLDESLEDALRRAKKPYSRLVSNLDVAYDSRNQVQIIKLTGTIEQPDSLILTTDDYSDFFDSLSALSITIKFYLASNTLVFLGYDLKDPLFQRLYRSVVRLIDRHRRLAYAVCDNLTEAQVKLWENRGLKIISQMTTEFLNELKYHMTQTQQTRMLTQLPRTLPDHPYQFLDYFTTKENNIFFGRALETTRLAQLAGTHKLSILHGHSGVGKSSIICAGLIPDLNQQGFRCVYVRIMNNPVLSIKLAVTETSVDKFGYTARTSSILFFLKEILNRDESIVIILDQFEELFVRFGKEVRDGFAHEIAQCLSQDEFDIRFIIVIRDDYFVALDEWTQIIPDILNIRFRLTNLTLESAQTAIERPAELFNLKFETLLVEKLLQDLTENNQEYGVEPSSLQIICQRLYEHLILQHKNEFTIELYENLGGHKSILANYLDEAIDELTIEEEKDAARSVLKSMVTSEQTKADLQAHEVASDEISSQSGLSLEKVEDILSYFTKRRIIRTLLKGDEIFYELAHEVLVKRIWDWMSIREAEIKYIRELMRQSVKSYNQLGLLMDVERLQIVHQYLNELRLSTEEEFLLLRSAIANTYEAEYWIRRAAVQLPRLEDELIKLLFAPASTSQVRVLASTALSKVSNNGSAQKLIEFLENSLQPHQKGNPMYNSLPSQQLALFVLAGMVNPLAENYLRQLTPEGYCFVPAGYTVIGSEDAPSEGPVHEIFLSAFWIARTPVTNAQFKLFIDSNGYIIQDYWTKEGWDWKGSRTEPREWSPQKYLASSECPVGHITWFEAIAYTNWLAKTSAYPVCLLNEAQWEKAATWNTEMKKKTRYPWGNDFEKNRCNTNESLIRMSTQVTKYANNGASFCGAYDMIGNIWEWTRSLYRPYPFSNDGRDDLETQGNRVQRGGAWTTGKDLSTGTFRFGERSPRNHRHDCGFRCAIAILPSKLYI